MDKNDIIELDSRYVSPSTRIPFVPTVVVGGRGAELFTADNRTLLDLHSMACITNVGQCHPRVVEAVRRQAGTLFHANSAYVHHEGLARLAAELARITLLGRDQKVAFGATGSDANDGAIKLARAATGRPKIIAFLGAYHGQTYGALSLSAVSLAMRRGFGPFVPDIHHIPFPDAYRPTPASDAEGAAAYSLEALDRLFFTVAPPEEVAAVIVEPIQGDSGVLVPPTGFLIELENRCRRHGILLIAEEVQTGMGRTGDWFASRHFGIEPDVFVVGKALGSGLPISAIVARSELMSAWTAPGHVFSTGANPICVAAALATIQVIEEEGLIHRAHEIGQKLREGFVEMAGRHEAIGDVRGRGLMLGVDLVTDRTSRAPDQHLTLRVLARCHQLGLYMTSLGSSVLRIAPPLVLSAEQADSAIERVDQALIDAASGRVTDSEVAEIKGW